MDTYIYRSAMYCEACGEKIRARLTAIRKAPLYPEDEHTYDSDEFPKGPYSDGGGESDVPEHCDMCSVFLENPLTTEGYNYVKQHAVEDMEDQQSISPIVTEWLEFYCIP